MAPDDDNNLVQHLFVFCVVMVSLLARRQSVVVGAGVGTWAPPVILQESCMPLYEPERTLLLTHTPSFIQSTACELMREAESVTVSSLTYAIQRNDDVFIIACCRRWQVQVQQRVLPLGFSTWNMEDGND